VGAIFEAANITISDCLVPMISRPGQSIDGKSRSLTARENRESYGKCVLAKSGYAFYRREIEAVSLVNIENKFIWSRAARQKAVENLPPDPRTISLQRGPGRAPVHTITRAP
jgi:hypothetical protein